MDATTLEDLSIRLASVPDEGLDLDLRVSPELLAEILGEKEPFRAPTPMRITAHIQILDEVVHIRGRIDGQLDTDCARCNEPITLGIKPKFEFTCFPEGSEPRADAEGEISEDDMEVSTYSGDSIDLSSMLRDEVFLTLPMYPDCTHSVAGQCAEYDEKLRQSAPPVEDEPGGKLFEALKGIKLNKPD